MSIAGMWKYVCFVLVFQFVFREGESVTFIKPKGVVRNLIVSTNNGYIQGRTKTTYNGKTFWAYQGIPYAKPPIGNLRFRASEPSMPWKGVLDATEEGQTCVETIPGNSDVTVSGYEDCLYINVYAPENPQNTSLLKPVLIWIYGGAFIFGNSSSEFYGPDNFLDRDIVVVTFNYRVGIFGFLSTMDMESPGNYGLKDQNLALKWVQLNIKNFGGDKNSVTIAGQSAGAASVFYHIASPKSEGLFNNAIANSGSSLCSWSYQRNPKRIAFDVGLAVGIKTKNTEDLVARLRKTDIEELKKASRLIVLLFVPQTDREGFPFGPSIEPYHRDAFLTNTAFSSFEKGNFNRVPILTGVNTLETMFFDVVFDLIRPLNILYDLSPGSLPSSEMNIKTAEERRKAGLAIKKLYFKSGSYIEATKKELFEYTSDERFIRPIRKTVQLVSRYTQLYFYVFSYVGDYGLTVLEGILDSRPVHGVPHLEEEAYVWKRSPVPHPEGLDKLTLLRVMQMWSNFIKTSNPTPLRDDLLQGVVWPQVRSPKNITYLEIDKDLSIKYNYRQMYMEYWDKLYKIYGHRPYSTY
ncbi:unnamed protein product [Phaedon cochleariae]|uniref:Carboxylic ester hydrolase n=1 Tax=Phaedon cochleariae TaxID=80249 RepID=A0A9P0D9J8_PHACE|nr:unnamed protein product [Phaedon cochleariae]